MNTLKCTLTSQEPSEVTYSPLCVINRKNAISCGFCGINETGENVSNC